MTSITFYNSLRGDIEKTMSESEYESVCKRDKNVFEVIPSDKPVKLYFDADYVFYEDNHDYNESVANDVLKLNKEYITRSIEKATGVKPVFSVAESHSRGRVKSGKDVWGYSFHIVCPNILCLKADMKVFTKQLNDEIMKDQKTADDKYEEYFTIKDITEFKPFDTMVYGDGTQKFRSVYSSKDGENRPFNIVEGTFNDMCITGFIGNDATTFTPEYTRTEIKYEINDRKPINNNINIDIVTTEDSDNLFKKLAFDKEKKDNLLFVKIALDGDILLSRSKDTEKWLATSMFIKGYFGDNNESVELYNKFSMLYANKYNLPDNMERWGKFVTNDKYNNFGTFISWCKEEDKVKTKDILQKIKEIKKNESDEAHRIQLEKKEADKLAKAETQRLLIEKKQADKLEKEQNKEALRLEKDEAQRLILEKKEAERIDKDEARRILLENKEEARKSALEKKEEKANKLREMKENEFRGEALFKEMSTEFELEHTKIINGSIYIKRVEERVVFMTKRDMITSYEHIQCGFNPAGFPVSFIDKWMVNNTTINVKDKMDVYPDVENCPDTVYNLWTPFIMEKFTQPYYKKNDELNLILNHIKILCGNDAEMYKYFIKWISKMIQQPHVKLTCMLFISKQGAGKGTLMELFRRMMGSEKVYETTNPSRDVWGNFNELMSDAFLVNINEFEYVDAKKGEGQFKGLITDPFITINPKGQKPIKVKSHHHFIGTTNKENPIPLEKSDRRFVIVKSSDEKCKDTVYFTQLYRLLEDNETVRTVYDYFKNFDISEFDHTIFPETQCKKDLMELNLTAPELWIRHFVVQKHNKGVIELLGKEVLNLFTVFCEQNKYRYDTNTSKLAGKIKNMELVGITTGRHTSDGNTKYYDIDKLKEELGLGCVVEL